MLNYAHYLKDRIRIFQAVFRQQWKCWTSPASLPYVRIGVDNPERTVRRLKRWGYAVKTFDGCDFIDIKW